MTTNNSNNSNSNLDYKINSDKTNSDKTISDKTYSNDIKNVCHFACSSINWVNTFLLFVIIVILYQYLDNK